MPIAGELHLEMARPEDELFEEDTVVAEGGARLAFREFQRMREIRCLIDAAHALAAAAGAGLDEDGKADAPRFIEQKAWVLGVAVIAGNADDTGLPCQTLRFDFRSHH